MEQHVIPTRPGMGRGLINHDPKSKQYRALDLVDTTVPRTKTWRRGREYDQGQTSQCVAFTGKGVLNTRPMSLKWPWEERSAFSTDEFYAGAQRNDEWTGEDYDGTSGLGLCRYLKRNGYITAFHWNFTLEEYKLCLSHVGPIGFGAMWKTGMWNTDSNGFIHYTGDDIGGHEVELIGNSMEERCFILSNSWGESWGVAGRAKLSWDDAGLMIDNWADGFVITA